MELRPFIRLTAAPVRLVMFISAAFLALSRALVALKALRGEAEGFLAGEAERLGDALLPVRDFDFLHFAIASAGEAPEALALL